MNIHRLWSRFGPAVMLAALGLPVAAHAYVSTATRWMADSFCYGNILHRNQESIWLAMKHWHRQWTGRYGFNFAETISGLAGPGLAPWLPSTYLAVWLGVAVWLARGLLPRPQGEEVGNRRWTPWLLGTLAPFVTLTAIPEVFQSVYWTSGLHNYVPPLVLGTTLAALTAQAARTGERAASAGTRWRPVGAGALRAALCGALAFAAGGFSEMYGSMQVMLLAWLTAAAIGAAATGNGPGLRRALPCLAAGLIGASAAMAIVLTAPGNANRATQMPPPLELARVPGLAFRLTVAFVSQVMGRAPLTLAGAAALAGVLGFAWGPIAAGRRAAARTLVWIPLAAGGALLTVYAVSAYAFTGPPPGRGVIVPQYALTLAWTAWWFAGGLWLRMAGVGQAQDREMRLWRAGVMALAGALLVNAAWLAWQTVGTRPVYAAYAKGWDERERAILAVQALGGQRIGTPPLANPSLLEEAGPNFRHWVNGCIGDYYGLQLTAVEPPAPPEAAVLEAMRPLDAQLGIVARVGGYAIEGDPTRAGEVVRVTVFWQPLAASLRPLTVFVHLYDSERGSLAQHDAQPLGGAYPTTDWVYGHLFAETYTLTTPSDLPAGSRPVVAVGLYELETLEREPASGAGADEMLNWVVLEP